MTLVWTFSQQWLSATYLLKDVARVTPTITAGRPAEKKHRLTPQKKQRWPTQVSRALDNCFKMPVTRQAPSRAMKPHEQHQFTAAEICPSSARSDLYAVSIILQGIKHSKSWVLTKAIYSSDCFFNKMDNQRHKTIQNLLTSSLGVFCKEHQHKEAPLWYETRHIQMSPVSLKGSLRIKGA